RGSMRRPCSAGLAEVAVETVGDMESEPQADGRRAPEANFGNQGSDALARKEPREPADGLAGESLHSTARSPRRHSPATETRATRAAEHGPTVAAPQRSVDRPFAAAGHGFASDVR